MRSETRVQATMYGYDGVGRRVKKTGGTQYLKADHLGSTRLVTIAGGGLMKRYNHLPFGQDVLSSTASARLNLTGYTTDSSLQQQFTSKLRDYESGISLDYFGARYFSAAQGRFTTADPQRFNSYAYARNNPLKFVDPSGEAIELSSDPAEREKQMQGLCALAGNDVCNQYLCVDDKYKKGHYYVGILAGGQSGKGPDFGSLNGVTASLQDIIWDPHVMTVDFVQGSDRIQLPPGSGPSLNMNHAEGAAVSVNGQLHVYVRASDDPKGYSSIPFYDMSNWWTFTSGARDQNTVLAHELGHLSYYMKNESIVPSKSNDDALSLENQVRKLKDPNAPTRTGH